MGSQKKENLHATTSRRYGIPRRMAQERMHGFLASCHAFPREISRSNEAMEEFHHQGEGPAHPHAGELEALEEDQKADEGLDQSNVPTQEISLASACPLPRTLFSIQTLFMQTLRKAQEGSSTTGKPDANDSPRKPQKKARRAEIATGKGGNATQGAPRPST